VIETAISINPEVLVLCRSHLSHTLLLKVFECKVKCLIHVCGRCLKRGGWWFKMRHATSTIGRWRSFFCNKYWLGTTKSIQESRYGEELARSIKYSRRKKLNLIQEEEWS